MVRTQFDAVVKLVRSENGTEFKPLKPSFSDLGILFQTSCPGTPQQKGRVERKHRQILEVGRAWRFQANIPIPFLGECILTAGYLINRTPNLLNDGKSPYELLYQKAPHYTHRQVFACLSYARCHCSEKFAPRSTKSVFLGYPTNQKGWTVLDIETARPFLTRDVRFVEDEFPFDTRMDTSAPLPSNIPKVSSETVDVDELAEMGDRGRAEYGDGTRGKGQ